MREPSVSIILVAFNEPKYLIEKAINSIIAQTYSDFEFLIIDESFKKETINLIKEKASNDKRIKILKTDKFGFFSNSLNRGLKEAKGKFIARMDPDDISYKSRIELQVKFLEENPKYSVVGSAMEIIDKNGNHVSYRKYPKSSFNLRIWTLLRNPLAHPTVMVRRSIIDKGFLYDETFPKAEDLELWLRLINKGFKIYNLDSFLLKYRIIGNPSDKRFGENFKYNFKARKKNFSWRYPIFSLISLVFAKIYFFLPKKIIDIFYKLID